MKNTDIAIIGLSGRLPGISDLSELNDIFVNKVDCVVPFKDERRDLLKLDKNIKYFDAAYIDGVQYFDYNFFNISRQEAKNMDPQQKMILELAYSAIEDGGYSPDDLRGTNTSVMIGVHNSHMYDDHITDNTGIAFLGSFLDALAGQSEYYAELEKLRTRFNRLPQKNAIPSFASALERIANSAGNDMAQAAVNEVNTLLETNTKLSERNDELEGVNQELTGKNDELTQNLTAVTEEKEGLIQQKEILTAEKEELVATSQELRAQNEELNTANKTLSRERDALAAERDSLANEKLAWSGEKESLSTQVTTLTGQLKNATAEQEILSTRVKTLDSRTKDLTSQNDAYAQLLETLVSQDSSTHGFVAKVNSSSKVQLYVGKSKSSVLSTQYGGSNELPVGVVSGGKIIAAGKIKKEGGSWYMVSVKAENQGAVNEWLSASEGMEVSSDASFAKIKAGQGIVIGSPLFLGE